MALPKIGYNSLTIEIDEAFVDAAENDRYSHTLATGLPGDGVKIGIVGARSNGE